MDLHNLALFHAIAEAGSITAGAQRMHLSQPAASKRLADLERSLGTPLFDRLPKRGIRPTAAGEVLLAFSSRVAALEAQAERALRGLSGGEAGRLMIGASSTIGTYLLPPAIAAFRTERPGVEVDLRIGNSDAIVALLRDAHIDVAFTEDNRAEVGEGIVSERLAGDDLLVCCRVGHPLLQREALRSAELVRYPFILREHGSGARAVFTQALAASGATVTPDLVLGSNEAIKRALTACNHLAALPRMAVSDELANGLLAELSVQDLRMQRDLHILRQAWRQDSPPIAAFLGILRRPAGRNLVR
jgi:DNA-binding transcriptional LysR family regulator